MAEISSRARHDPARTSLRHEARWLGSALLALVALMWMTGCATRSGAGRHSAFQDAGAPSGLEDDGGGFGFWMERDDFQLLQQSAGLEEDSWHEGGEELETDDAQALWEALARTGTTLQSFGPRRSLLFVLRQVLTRDEDVPYAELLERLRPFHFLVVMRPDGYLVSALRGRPLQRMGMGRVELREGRLMVGTFEVGAFYRDKGGVFYAVDDSLSRPGVMVGELGLERDWFNAALDGGGDALGEMAQALAQLVNDPIRSLEGLQQLPSAVAALIASSPEYFARYSARPLQEQIREAARLSGWGSLLAAGPGTNLYDKQTGLRRLRPAGGPRQARVAGLAQAAASPTRKQPRQGSPPTPECLPARPRREQPWAWLWGWGSTPFYA